MKPAPFELIRPATLTEALAVLADAGENGRPLAGGQSLVPLLNFRMATPAVLVDLSSLDELRYVHTDPSGAVRIGAMTTLDQLLRNSDLLASHSLLGEAMRLVAHPPIRNRTTLGGTLAHADPSAEMPAASLLLGATLVLTSSASGRAIPASDFFVGPYTTVVEDGELVTEIRFPPTPPSSGAAIVEVAHRTGDFALAGAAAVVVVADGRVRNLRVVVFGAAARPTTLEAVDSAATGQWPDEVWIAAIARQYSEGVAAVGDLHASAAFRAHLAGVVVERALRSALSRAGAPTATRSVG